MGIQDPIYPTLMERAEQATTAIAESQLTAGANTTQEGEHWIQLAANLKYALITITTAAAATVVRQHHLAMGLEVYRQLCLRFSTPLGTRSIGYLTKLLKPTFDHNNFEESFSNWEFELQRYEADNTTRLPDQVKIAVLMNETRGPLQQHLHLNAGTAPTYAAIRATIMEYYRTTMAFTRLHQQSSAVSSNLGGGTAPMDIGATYNGKGKGKGKHKGKGKGKNNSKGKGYGYKGYGMNNKGKGKGKQQWQPVQQAKGDKGKGRTKDNGKEKERVQCQVVTYVVNLDTWQETAGQQSTTCQRHNKSKHKMQQVSGMTNKMDTMPTGTAVTLLAIPDINSIHSNLHYQHLQHNKHKLDRSTQHQQYTQSTWWHQQYTNTAWLQPLWMQFTMTTRLRLWLTVVQQHMFAQHGLRLTHPCTHSNKDRDRTSERLQTSQSQHTDTSGFGWQINTTTN